MHWTKPAALEEYLLPPLSGIDWRVPQGIDKILQQAGTKAGTQDTILEFADQTNVTVLQVKFQSHDHGSVYYNTHLESMEEPDFETVFHATWNIFFTPSPELAASIEETLHRTGLIPGQYTAAHLRALYTSDKRNDQVLKSWTQNSINCALQMQQPKLTGNSLPVYFASDSDKALRFGIMYGKTFKVDVVSREAKYGKNPLHIDKTSDWQVRPPTDFFEVFIDLYVMALSKCVTYGMGGYGRFASLMSGNTTCSIVHMSATYMEPCDVPPRRRRQSGSFTIETESIHDSTSSIFLLPMPPNFVFKEEKNVLRYPK
jgi:hypothetical protein